MTGRHHTHVTPFEAAAAVRSAERLELVATVLSALHAVNANEAMTSGLLVWAANAAPWTVAAMLKHSSMRKVKSHEAWAKVAKSFSRNVKSHQHYAEEDLSDLFESQVTPSDSQLQRSGRIGVSFRDHCP